VAFLVISPRLHRAAGWRRGTGDTRVGTREASKRMVPGKNLIGRYVYLPRRITSINSELCFAVCSACPFLRPEARLGTCSQQSINFIFHCAIAFARVPFQTLTVNDSNMAPRIMDQAGILKVAGRYCDTLASSSQHVGNELLRHDQLIHFHSVVA